MATVLPIETIVSDPNIRGGHPIIAGTSICVTDIVASHVYRGLPPEELATNFALDMGQVYAALDYYYLHKSNIDALMKADAAKAHDLLAAYEAKKKLIRIP